MPDTRTQNTLVLGIAGAGDLVAGLVLAALGLMRGSQVLALVGTVLLLSGAGMLAYLAWSRSRPETL